MRERLPLELSHNIYIINLRTILYIMLFRIQPQKYPILLYTKYSAYTLPNVFLIKCPTEVFHIIIIHQCIHFCYYHDHDDYYFSDRMIQPNIRRNGHTVDASMSNKRLWEGKKFRPNEWRLE